MNQNGYYDFCLMYHATHGEEDKKNIPNPKEQEQFIQDFNEMYNA